VVNYNGAGSCLITASNAQTAFYLAATSIIRTITVSQASQTVTFTSGVPPSTPIGGTFTVTATATSGGAVSFATLTPAICSVSGSTVTFNSAGLCQINGTQSGTTNYSPAWVVEPIGVALLDQTIGGLSTMPVSPVVDGSYVVSATASSGLTVVYSVTTPATCSIVGNVVTFLATGTCTIAFNQGGKA
jgi:hypothetical protein